MNATTPLHKLSHDAYLSLPEVTESLIVEGMIPSDHIGKLRSLAPSAALHPLVQIAELSIPTRDDPGVVLDCTELGRWLARKANLPFYRIDPMDVDVEGVTKLISQAYARQYRILPVEVHATHAVIATTEPFALNWLGDLGQILRREIRVVVANPLDLNRFQLEFYGVSRSVARATSVKEMADTNAVLNFEQLLELGRTAELKADDQHVVYIVDWLLNYAFDQRASDIHLEPRRERSNVRFRIDGKLHTVYQIPSAVMGAVTSRIKILGRMDVAEKRRPQDGRIKTRSPAGREVELRLSTMPTAFGEKCVMRIFDPDVANMTFEELGFSDRELARWKGFIERPHGIVLVTGPTGSGKTTTLYATLKHLASPDINLCTVEDPIEMVSPEFNQMQVQPGIGVTFAQGVRTLLRQDPDIIMIGEIRDLETAQMAVQSSLTGHLVLSTLHTNDAPSAITRLLDLGVPHYLLGNTIVGVVAQRLVRTLCSECKVSGTVDEEVWRWLCGGYRIRMPKTAMAPVGCEACRETGYRGRTAIYEMMPVDREVAGLIRHDCSAVELGQAAVKKGMHPLAIAAARKVALGLTTLDEVTRVVTPPENHSEPA